MFAITIGSLFSSFRVGVLFFFSFHASFSVVWCYPFVLLAAVAVAVATATVICFMHLYRCHYLQPKNNNKQTN